MSVVASGPPFWGNPPLCKCGWMWADECKKTEGCGLKNGMPEFNREQVLSEEWGLEGEFIKPNNPLWEHTPYEFLHETAYKAAAYSPPAPQIVDLNKVCREVVEGLVKEKDALKEFHAEVRRRHPSVDWHGPGKGVHEDDGEPITLDGIRDWVKNGPPGSIKHGDSKSTQVGGKHYESLPLQPWDIFRKNNTPEGYCTYHINTIMAYLMRHDKKGGLTDLKKALDHLRELIRYFEEEQEYPW